MNEDLIHPAAVLTAELLRRQPAGIMDLTPHVIASAFETAYRGIEAGIDRVRAEDARETERVFAQISPKG